MSSPHAMQSATNEGEAQFAGVCAWTLFVVLCAIVCSFPVRYTPPPKRVIIDTDVGDDIDDAFAILTALKMHCVKKIHILAFFTAGKGSHAKRARLIEALKDAVCADALKSDAMRIRAIPIYLGSAGGSSASNYMDFPNPDCPRNTRYKTIAQEKNKINRLTTKSSRRVLYIGIGPLDNLRELNPDPLHVKLVLMGGSFEKNFDGQRNCGDFNEYNVRNDPKGWIQALQKYKTLVVPLDIAADKTRISNWGSFIERSPWVFAHMYNCWYEALRYKNPRHPILRNTMEQGNPMYPGDWSNIQFDTAALLVAVVSGIAQIEKMHVRVTKDGCTKKIDHLEPNARVAVAFYGNKFHEELKKYHNY